MSNFNTLEILMIVLIALNAIFLVMALWLILKYKKLFRGKQGSDLERLIMSYIQDITLAGSEIEKIKKHLEFLQKQADGAMQKISLKRFNPFEDVGGDQSFSLAVLDMENSGFVITSLFTREGTRIYSKSIKKGQSPNTLIDEEKVALKEAMSQK